MIPTSDKRHLGLNGVSVSLTGGDEPGGSATLSIDACVYTLSVVLRALHSLAPRAVGKVSRQSAESWAVELRSGSSELLNARELETRFLLALGDFVLRDRLEAETIEVRTLVVRQAFERCNLQWPILDQASPGEDPLGLGSPDRETGRSHL